ncbi:carbohydrate ABC transporter substrate-binding protein, CUT1 family [Cellulosimicrobium aquatile]|uniref:Carbohydrate ABC transporter substrate-binding protein, CUT1 family n=1 Tax=Cellulosimicrobium aquatile TaxID=1612203 RepID=A0A1N6PRE9_9MICO|nr:MULTISPECIES: extracellular solute-binding protein [Cellulosimicrobium]MCM3535063.1 extracellular solute-binding protein [Cellulosimicrobium funkei]SIQ06965.1 carbohydrate ABC transporter substrate-binding protein, CUT1 family [Cellulosimicrobium aquatile]
MKDPNTRRTTSTASRPLRLVALTALAGLALSACGFGGQGGGGESEGDGTTIDLLVPTYSDQTKSLWEDVIAGFEDENPDITVNLEVQSWDNINDVVRTKVQSDQAPDILNIDAFAGFVEDDLLYSADEVLSPDTIADFQESFVENASMDGTQYGLPLIASARTMFYNKDLFTQAGLDPEAPPKTWDELKDAATKISALGGGTYGYGLPLGSEEAQAETAIWFFGNGGGYGDASEITVDTPENVEAAQFFQSLAVDGLTQPDAGATDRTPLIDVFIQGKIGMIVGLPPTIGQIEEKNPELSYGTAPVATKDGSPVTLGVADHLMAFTNEGDKQDAITAFLDYFYSPEVYVPWVDAEGFIPVTKSGGEELATKESIAPFLDLLPDAQFYPSTNPQWSATQGAVQSLVGQVAQGKDAQAVLTEIQAKADQ